MPTASEPAPDAHFQGSADEWAALAADRNYWKARAVVAEGELAELRTKLVFLGDGDERHPADAR